MDDVQERTQMRQRIEWLGAEEDGNCEGDGNGESAGEGGRGDGASKGRCMRIPMSRDP